MSFSKLKLFQNNYNFHLITFYNYVINNIILKINKMFFITQKLKNVLGFLQKNKRKNFKKTKKKTSRVLNISQNLKNVFILSIEYFNHILLSK